MVSIHLILSLLVGSVLAHSGTRACRGQQCDDDRLCVVASEGEDTVPYCVLVTDVDSPAELEVSETYTTANILHGSS